MSWERPPRTHTPTCAATMCPYVGMACALFCSEESRPGTRRRASEPVPHGGSWGNAKVWQADGTLGSLPTVLAGGGCCRLVGDDGTSNHALATLSDPVWPCPWGPLGVLLGDALVKMLASRLAGPCGPAPRESKCATRPHGSLLPAAYPREWEGEPTEVPCDGVATALEAMCAPHTHVVEPREQPSRQL